MVIFKEGVVIKRLTEPLYWILVCLKKVDGTDGFPTDLVVTSVNDGEHSKVPLSRHYTDEAIDVRAKNFSGSESKNEFIILMNTFLNKTPGVLRKDAFIILHEYKGTEKEHFHIQVKKGETFP